MSGVPSGTSDVSDDAGEEVATAGASQRERLVGLLGAVKDRLCSLLPNGGSSGSEETDSTSNSAESQCEEFLLRYPDFPDREYPLTYPGRDLSDINTTDVVGIETDAGFRLSVPENPDATIVSDEWVDNEP